MHINTIYKIQSEAIEKEALINILNQFKQTKNELKEYDQQAPKEPLQGLRFKMIQILSEKILKSIQENQNQKQFDNFSKQWSVYKKQLESELLNQQQETDIHNKITFFCQQISENNSSLDQRAQVIDIWQIKRLSISYIKKISDNFNLHNLINTNISGIIDAVCTIIFYIKNLDCYEFYKTLLLLILEELNIKLNQENNYLEIAEKKLENF